MLKIINKFLRKRFLKKIAKNYICVLNDLEELKDGIISEKEEEGTTFEHLAILNGLIERIGEMQEVLVNIGRTKYSMDLHQEQPTQESE